MWNGAEQLTQAEDAVNSEIVRLEQTTRQCLAGLEATFHEITISVEQRRTDMSQAITQARDAKKKVLDEQLALIQSEKDKVCSAVTFVSLILFEHLFYLRL